MHLGVADTLGMRITGGELGPGSVVGLAGIEDEFEVSRTVAREAMRLLESLGMLRARRGVGIIVTPISEWSLLDPKVIEWRLAGPGGDDQVASLVDLRVAVEPVASRLAAIHASEQQRTALVEMALRLQELGNQGLGVSEEFLHVDVDFHLTLLRASGNEMIAALSDVVRAVLVGRTRIGSTPAVPVAEVLHHHEMTARAIREGMPEAAEVCSRTLVTLVRREIRV